MANKIVWIISCCIISSPLYAWDWQQWFFTDDQRGQRAFQEQQHQNAARLFNQPEWQGSAFYRAGDYSSAIDSFANSSSALATYNRGNALAKLGDYNGAINAYDEALSKQPDFEDAKYNKAYLEKLLKQQQKQPSESQESKLQEEQPKNSKQGQQPNQQRAPDQQSKQNPQHQTRNNKQATEKNQELLKAEQKKSNRKIDQALQIIPDNPGGLLQQKFLRDHLRQQQEKL